VDQVFQAFGKVRVETLESSFHSLAIDAEGRRKSYWVVVVEK